MTHQLKYELTNYPLAQFAYLVFFVISESNECNTDVIILSGIINIIFEINRGLIFVYPKKCEDDVKNYQCINQCPCSKLDQKAQQQYVSLNNEQNNEDDQSTIE
ncbi:Hypothetical_protein [Hexamita inflata]|uniref:Hypothetical_protein n=1 Tax=Hexamita inflata TaxID=28002 RepID=A0ABP1HIP0_9EUKA